MWSAAMSFAEKYDLLEKAKSQCLAFGESEADSEVLKADVAKAARDLCDRILNERNWNTYYLHNPEGRVTEVRPFRLSIESISHYFKGNYTIRAPDTP